MARRARVKCDQGIFYIRQCSCEDQELFRGDEDRSGFLHILEQTSQLFAFDVLFFCVLDPDAYHLVIKLNGSDLSKIMKSLNISYLKYRKLNTQLYRDRYKSQWIEDEEALDALIQTLRMTRQNEGQWSKFCGSTQSAISCESCITSIDAANLWLEEKYLESGINAKDLKNHKSHRNTWILELRQRSTLSLKEMGHVFGGLSESTVCKIIKFHAVEISENQEKTLSENES